MLEAIDPWGQYREDLRFAKLTADIATMLGVKKEGRAVNMMDFLMDFDKWLAQAKAPVKAQSPAALERQVLDYAFTHNLILERHATQTRHFQKLG